MDLQCTVHCTVYLYIFHFWSNISVILSVKCTDFFLRDTQILRLKVVCNEKGGGSGGWLLFEDGFGPWRSMSEPVLFNVYGAPELMPRNEFRQPM